MDFDGVLHPYDESAEQDLDEAKLFCWAPILEEILGDIDPAGRIKIVLSTTWAQRTHWTAAKNYLPAGLKSRVIGGTTYAPVSRGIQIELHTMDYGIPDDPWIASDDDDYNCQKQHLDKLIN